MLPLCRPASPHSKPQDVCALLPQDWGHGACSGRLTVGLCVFWGEVVHRIWTGQSPPLWVGRVDGLKKNLIHRISQFEFLRFRVSVENAIFSV